MIAGGLQVSRARLVLTVVAAAALGAAFGSGAHVLMRNLPAGIDSGVLWVLVTLVSGTWLWALFGVLLPWVLTRRSGLAPLGHWLWNWGVSSAFLTTTTVGWYGAGRTGGAMASLVLFSFFACLLVGAATGFVAAFLSEPGALGLAARLSLSVGLAFILLMTIPPPIGSSAAALPQNILWWTLQALGIAWACGSLGWFALRRREA